MQKWIDTIEKLISDIEDHRNALQIAQDNFESEMEDFDPDDEDAIEPEEVNYEVEIDNLDDALAALQRVKEYLNA